MPRHPLVCGPSVALTCHSDCQSFHWPLMWCPYYAFISAWTLRKAKQKLVFSEALQHARALQTMLRGAEELRIAWLFPIHAVPYQGRVKQGWVKTLWSFLPFEYGFFLMSANPWVLFRSPAKQFQSVCCLFHVCMEGWGPRVPSLSSCWHLSLLVCIFKKKWEQWGVCG